MFLALESIACQCLLEEISSLSWNSRMGVPRAMGEKKLYILHTQKVFKILYKNKEKLMIFVNFKGTFAIF